MVSAAKRRVAQARTFQADSKTYCNASFELLGSLSLQNKASRIIERLLEVAAARERQQQQQSLEVGPAASHPYSTTLEWREKRDMQTVARLEAPGSIYTGMWSLVRGI